MGLGSDKAKAEIIWTTGIAPHLDPKTMATKRTIYAVT